MEWTSKLEARAEAQGNQQGVRWGVRLAELDNSGSGFGVCLIHAKRLRGAEITSV